MSIWRKNGKLVYNPETGKLINCPECPCNPCVPRCFDMVAKGLYITITKLDGNCPDAMPPEVNLENVPWTQPPPYGNCNCEWLFNHTEEESSECELSNYDVSLCVNEDMLTYTLHIDFTWGGYLHFDNLNLDDLFITATLGTTGYNCNNESCTSNYEVKIKCGKVSTICDTIPDILSVNIVRLEDEQSSDSSNSSSSADGSNSSSSSDSSNSSNSEVLTCCTNYNCSGTACSSFSNWVLNGVTPAYSDNCTLYVTTSFTLFWGFPNQRVDIYKDSARTQLVAYGSRLANGTLTIGGYFSGTVYFNGIGSASTATLTCSEDDNSSSSSSSDSYISSASSDSSNSSLSSEDISSDSSADNQCPEFLPATTTLERYHPPMTGCTCAWIHECTYIPPNGCDCYTDNYYLLLCVNAIKQTFTLTITMVNNNGIEVVKDAPLSNLYDTYYFEMRNGNDCMHSRCDGYYTIKIS